MSIAALNKSISRRSKEQLDGGKLVRAGISPQVFEAFQITGWTANR
jgi:hypothetical protein